MLLILLLGILILQIFIIFRLFKRSESPAKEELEIAFYKAWQNIGVDRIIGELSAYARKMEERLNFLEKAFHVPHERGALGEIALEGILSDQLPPYMFGIREKIAGGVIPDAYIRSTNGIICIDSKFPLDNYMRMIEAPDPKEREIYRKKFLNDVKGHLDKVRRDYIRPDNGTAEFAFVYVPSEAIYWFLVNEAFDMVRSYIKLGVHIVSPLTLAHKIEIVKAGMEAKRLSEEAEKIKENIDSISEGFKRLDNNWRVFYETHLRNLWNKASEVDSSYKELRRRFDMIRKGLEP